jgi:hypothetical protein
VKRSISVPELRLDPIETWPMGRTRICSECRKSGYEVPGDKCSICGGQIMRCLDVIDWNWKDETTVEAFNRLNAELGKLGLRYITNPYTGVSAQPRGYVVMPVDVPVTVTSREFWDVSTPFAELGAY